MSDSKKHDIIHAALAEEVRRLKSERDVLQRRVDDPRDEVEELKQSVRYQIGDEVVQALAAKKDIFKLPQRLHALYKEGKRNEHSRVESECDNDESTVFTRPYTPNPHPDWLKSLEPLHELEGQFTRIPIEQVTRPNVKVAAILDEFSWRCWQYEADFYTFTPDKWEEAVGANRPDFLFVESTWLGLDGSWSAQIDSLGERPDLVGEHFVLPDLVDWCKGHDIPTIFYNKEDPPNFDRFIQAAKLFDFVFTSDSNCIPKYKDVLHHNRVFALPFAAQPRIHNSSPVGERNGSVCFAGAWYAQRHSQRQLGADIVLSPAMDFDLIILDRMSRNPSPEHEWPEKYRPAVYNALPYSIMVQAYKKFKVFLNINSVTDSPTMFSRRVFELLASGTPVISAPNKGIQTLLGDAVTIVKTEQETTKAICRLLTDLGYWSAVSNEGISKIQDAHTYSDRFDYILRMVVN